MLGSSKASSRRRAAYRPKKEPRQARARATYASILDGAAQLLAEQGYARLTTNHVADRAGVAIGSLYEYFPDKETIVAEVARRTIREILSELEGGLEGVLDQDPEAALREWVRVMFRAIKTRRDVVRALWRDVPFLADLDELARAREATLALARRWQTRVKMPSVGENPEAMAYLLTVMGAHGIVESVVARPRHLSQQEVEETFVRIVAALVF